MSNDPKVDLIYAILAMDAYNRGYGSGITGLSDQAGTQLGNHSVTRNADDPSKVALNAGFYAIAYRKGGETVVSYRGTDVKGLSADEQAGGSDPLNGYGLATGLTAYDANRASAANQSRLALEFFKAVAGNAPGTTRCTSRRHSRLVG